MQSNSWPCRRSELYLQNVSAGRHDSWQRKNLSFQKSISFVGWWLRCLEILSDSDHPFHIVQIILLHWGIGYFQIFNNIILKKILIDDHCKTLVNIFWYLQKSNDLLMFLQCDLYQQLHICSSESKRGAKGSWAPLPQLRTTFWSLWHFFSKNFSIASISIFFLYVNLFSLF